MFQKISTAGIFFLPDERSAVITTVYSNDPLNDTHREKMCFIQLSTRMTDWQLLTIFHMVTQSITFRHTFYYHILRARMFEE